MLKQYISLSLMCFVFGCSTGTTPNKAADPYSSYAPLGVGCDYKNYRKVNKKQYPSPTHGGRFVDTWVNDIGYAAYTSDAEMPVGTVLVKTSVEVAEGKPTNTPGPIFIMEKKSPGYSEATNDWYYAFHWAKTTSTWKTKLGERVYWRSPSPKVNYCYSCHENYDREIGLPPIDMRTWRK